MAGTLAMHLMRLIGGLFGYLSVLPKGKVVLWCYLIWYVVVVVHHFDPSPALWLNALGISAVIGFALLLSVGGSASRANDPWQTVRLFLLPFCVSSFSSLIKGKGFVLVFPPTSTERVAAVGQPQQPFVLAACRNDGRRASQSSVRAN